MKMKTTFLLLLAALLLVGACATAQPNGQTRAIQNPNEGVQTQPGGQPPTQVVVEQPPGPQQPGQQPPAENTTAQQPGANPQVKEFIVVARRFSFDPAVIRVQQGDTVKITASSADVAHGLAIPDFNVNLRLEPGAQPQTATFVADKKGTFTFYCDVYCGAGHTEMKGQLIVE
jgi:cytochrome c oxidase subunit 2